MAEEKRGPNLGYLSDMQVSALLAGYTMGFAAALEGRGEYPTDLDNLTARVMGIMSQTDLFASSTSFSKFQAADELARQALDD